MSDGAGPNDLVWHYTDAQGLLSILGGNTLWATSSQFLNDAGEVTLGSSLLKRELQERAATDPFYSTLTDLAVHASPDDGPSPGEFFVLSAARDWDLLAVWRNYGGRGESYAIGLDPTAALSVLQAAGTTGDVGEGRGAIVRHLPWAPVRYTDTEQRALVDAVFDDLKDEIAWAKQKAESGAAIRDIVVGLTGLLDDMEQALLLVKHSGFADEREIRHSTVLYRGFDSTADLPSGVTALDPLLGTLQPASRWPQGLVNYRATAYGLAPYLKLTGSTGPEPITTTAAPLPIRALAISPSAYSRATARTLHDLLRAHDYPAVPVHRSTIPFRE